MEFKKIANYNIRFADTISMEPLTIDITPAEVKESNGKVVYILRTIGTNTCDFGLCLGYNTDDSTITFMAQSSGSVEILTFQAESDNDFYILGD